jgi:uncharacterized protein YhaN
MNEQRKLGEVMLITRLYVNCFGKFSGKEIELKPGINLIYGENEAGKSTLHTFIKGMLFGIERLRGRGAATKEDVYTRYLPWDYPGAYGGQMDIKLGDKAYRLKRSFHANDKAFTILELISGREVKLKDGHISELVPGLTETTFRNTISIEQLRAETDAELASYVRNYITNLSIAKNREVNVEKAIGSLKEQKKAIELTPYDAQLKSLAERIKNCELREKRIDSLTISLKDLEGKEKSLREQLEGKIKSTKRQQEEELIEELPAIVEKFRTYQELKRQYSQLDSQILALEDKLIEHDKSLKYYDNKQEDIIKSRRRKSLLYIGVSLVAIILGFILTKSPIVAACILIVASVLGGVIWSLSNKNKATNRDNYLKNEMSLEHGKNHLKELTARRKSLEDGCDELHDTIMLYIQRFISEEELTPGAIERLHEAISSRKSEATREQSEFTRELEEYHFQIGKIRWELSQLEENETELIGNQEQYAYIMQKQKDNELETDAINLALNTIHELSATIHDSFGMQLNEAVSETIAAVTNNKYQDLKIDEKLSIKLGWKNNYIILDRLSAGTIDQVYFALRLTVADLLLGNEPMPLILDDSFALYDDKRTNTALSKIADREQVLLFSCQRREKRILEDLGLPFHYIEL